MNVYSWKESTNVNKTLAVTARYKGFGDPKVFNLYKKGELNYGKMGR